MKIFSLKIKESHGEAPPSDGVRTCHTEKTALLTKLNGIHILAQRDVAIDDLDQPTLDSIIDTLTAPEYNALCDKTDAKILITCLIKRAVMEQSAGHLHRLIHLIYDYLQCTF